MMAAARSMARATARTASQGQASAYDSYWLMAPDRSLAISFFQIGLQEDR
jgi:hypothetical protein